nr:MAG TPA: hypothetical protein [Caudoviricetes sp.]
MPKTAVFSVRVFYVPGRVLSTEIQLFRGFYITYQLQLYIKHRNEFLILFLEK